MLGSRSAVPESNAVARLRQRRLVLEVAVATFRTAAKLRLAVGSYTGDGGR